MTFFKSIEKFLLGYGVPTIDTVELKFPRTNKGSKFLLDVNRYSSPEENAYCFKGWFYFNNERLPIEMSLWLDGDKVAYIQCDEYTVEKDLSDVYSPEQTQLVRKNLLKVLTDLKKAGCDFKLSSYLGWRIIVALEGGMIPIKKIRAVERRYRELFSIYDGKRLNCKVNKYTGPSWKESPAAIAAEKRVSQILSSRLSVQRRLNEVLEERDINIVRYTASTKREEEHIRELNERSRHIVKLNKEIEDLKRTILLNEISPLPTQPVRMRKEIVPATKQRELGIPITPQAFSTGQVTLGEQHALMGEQVDDEDVVEIVIRRDNTYASDIDLSGFRLMTHVRNYRFYRNDDSCLNERDIRSVTSMVIFLTSMVLDGIGYHDHFVKDFIDNFRELYRLSGSMCHRNNGRVNKTYVISYRETEAAIRFKYIPSMNVCEYLERGYMGMSLHTRVKPVPKHIIEAAHKILSNLD